MVRPPPHLYAEGRQQPSNQGRTGRPRAYDDKRLADHDRETFSRRAPGASRGIRGTGRLPRRNQKVCPTRRHPATPGVLSRWPEVFAQALSKEPESQGKSHRIRVPSAFFCARTSGYLLRPRHLRWLHEGLPSVYRLSCGCHVSFSLHGRRRLGPLAHHFQRTLLSWCCGNPMSK